MKIALVSAYFYPKSSGGTEKYVYELAKKLKTEGHDVEIITVGENPLNYQYDEITVKGITGNKEEGIEVVAGIKPSSNLTEFKDLITNSKYNIIHFHTLTPAFSIHHITVAKKFGVKIYFTAHIASVTCIHGDLMQFGKIPCDGLILNHRCTACYLSKKKISISVSKILSSAITIINYPKTIASVVDNKKSDLFKLNELCDKIFVFTHWQHRIFLANGFCETKIEITTQILGKKILPNASQKNSSIKNIGFVGRISPEKGLHILIESFIYAKNPKLELHIAGITDDNEINYFNKLKELTSDQANINWHLNLNSVEVKSFYNEIDTLCIPSVCYETGPFVLYEAFENNIPVIANNLGDMTVWKDKKFDIKIYSNKNELIALLKTL